MSLNGIRQLRSINEYPAAELRKRYKESTRTKVFIDRCLLIADCCIALIAKSNDELWYTFSLPADYTNPNDLHHYLSEINPHLYISKHQGDSVTEYLVENFEQTLNKLPRYQLRKRLKDYMDFLEEWNDANEPRPVTLFACATIADLLYVKRRVRKLIEDEDVNLQVRVTTIDKLKTSGIASMIWEDV